MAAFSQSSRHTSSAPCQPCKILVADDSNSDRLLLKALLKKQGHEVFLAVDGEEAVEMFKRERPELVLLDALMPRMDGFEAAEIIKNLAGEQFVPIIFLTSLKEADSLALCLEAGGDDFLTKPYNSIILQAKISAFQRMRGMHQTVQRQRDQIALHNEHLIRKQEIAKKVFDKVAHQGCLSAPNIRHVLSPLAVFNGDVLLAAFRPGGGMFVLLGDFTGHGLSAAIGAMPLAQTFYGMAEKGFSLADVVKELNRKLKEVLPIGIFCCATMVHLDFVEKTVEVWNGGLPDGFVYRAETKELIPIKSFNLPLGVLSSREFNANPKVFKMANNDRFFMWSDGILEATNDRGEMYGEQRLMQIFQHSAASELFDEINGSVHRFIGSRERSDDISLAEVRMVDPMELGDMITEIGAGALQGPRDWKLDYELHPDTLRDFNPLPLLLHILMEIPGLRPQSGQLYTILAELYSNALEHGVMGLDSELKNSADGFYEYYRQRSQRLLEITDGFVRITMQYKGDDFGGVLTFRVKDSGKGFNFESDMADIESSNGYSGRGIALLRSMCRRVQYFAPGNEVEVEFAWTHMSNRNLEIES